MIEMSKLIIINIINIFIMFFDSIGMGSMCCTLRFIFSTDDLGRIPGEGERRER